MKMLSFLYLVYELIFIKYYGFLINSIILKKNNVNYQGIRSILGKIFIKNDGKIEIEKNVLIISNHNFNAIGGQEHCTLWVKKGGSLIIDKGARISNSTFVCSASIYIGKNVYIGGDCKFYDTNFHSIKYEERIQRPDLNIKSAPIRIEEGAFIGGGSIILKGVNIGVKSVVGSGSVITKSVPAGEIWAGNPAKFIRKIYE